MAQYEITYLVDTADNAKAVAQLISSTGATYQEVKDWGERELGYEIKGQLKARYYTGVIDTIPSNLSAVKKKLNFSEALIRYLIMRKDDESAV